MSLTVAGEEPVTQTFAEATEHRIPILGLYPGTDNQVTLRLESAEGYAETTQTIATRPLPEAFPTITVAKAEREMMEPGWNLSAFRINDVPVRPHPLIFDPKGEVRWFLDLSFADNLTTFPERLNNGNLVFGSGSTIYEYDMLGAEIDRWELGDYAYHHEIVEKPNGNLIIAVAKEGLDTVDDFVIEIDRETGDVVREWDFREVLDVDRQTYEQDQEDWLHMNALWYDAEDDALIMSGAQPGARQGDDGQRTGLDFSRRTRGGGRTGTAKTPPSTC